MAGPLYGSAVRFLPLCLSLLFATPALASGPVVIELYTSQACEACRRANAVVAGFAARPDVLPLTFPVDYWDYLGWTDTLALPEFAERQRAHARNLDIRGLQTPLAVVDGAVAGPALDRGALAGIVRARRAAGPARPVARFSPRGKRVAIGAGRPSARGADVWLVRFDPRLVNVRVEDGPNRGLVVPHRNVVRELVELGSWTGAARSFDLPAAGEDGLRSAVLVQARDDGRILAAAVEG
jgi:hypothetical protein